MTVPYMSKYYDNDCVPVIECVWRKGQTDRVAWFLELKQELSLSVVILNFSVCIAESVTLKCF